jgi:hypothetical protein
MKSEALMNTATTLFFICYIPEFYANYINKNANWYNVLEKVVMIMGTGFALGYAVNIQNDALIINYAPLFGLDTIALFMRTYYAYKNRNRDVTIFDHIEDHIDNPIHTINSGSSLESL